MPSLSLSVIVLRPSTLIKAALAGKARSPTRNNVLNQIINIHFNDLSERIAPDNKLLNMLITDYITVK